MHQTAAIVERVAEASGFTIHLSLVQAFIGLALLAVVLLSNAKSLLFMWDDSSFNLHGISYSAVHGLQ